MKEYLGVCYDCDCGECFYVQPDCCGELRPRCETGMAFDYYLCSNYPPFGCNKEGAQ